ncbi:MAG: PrgI family protein [Suipraeoptans sp.]
MNIQINKDIETYRSEMWKGLTLRQLTFVGAGIVVGSLTMLLVYKYCYVPLEMATYIGLPIIIGIGVFGLAKINDMTLLEYIKERWRLAFLPPLLYTSEEYSRLMIQDTDTKKKKRTKDKTKKEGR